MKIIQILPTFLECEDGLYNVDLSKVECFIAKETSTGDFVVEVITMSGSHYPIAYGFKTIEEAKKYKTDLLEAYRKF